MAFMGRVLSGFVSGVLVALAIWIVVELAFKEDIQDWLVSRDPTCQNPGDLSPVDTSTVVAEGPTSPDSVVKEGGGEPSDAVDGYSGSWWVPELLSPRGSSDLDSWHMPHLGDETSRTLTLTLTSVHDVELVCVVSGLPESRSRYEMHGSVRDIAVWGDDPAAASQNSLVRLGLGRMRLEQEAGSSLGRTKHVHIRIDNVYSGQSVETFEADDCRRGPKAYEERLPTLEDAETPQRRYLPGCIRAPVPVAGIAEVAIYVKG